MQPKDDIHRRRPRGGRAQSRVFSSMACFLPLFVLFTLWPWGNAEAGRSVGTAPGETETWEDGADDPLSSISPRVPATRSLALSRSYFQRRNLQNQYVFDRHIRVACRIHGMDYHLIKAIVRTESAFRSDAVSPKGAKGLMQLMPQTADNLKVAEPFDAYENVEGGIRYFKKMMKLFNNDRSLALAAYNAGPEAVRKHKGIPPYEETRLFVETVLDLYQRYQEAGF